DTLVLVAELAVLTGFVVVSEDVHDLLKSVITGLGVVASCRRGARRVFLVNYVDELLTDLEAFGPPLLINFVAYAPDDHAGMIAVATNLGTKILLVPIVKQEMVIIWLFGSLPAVEAFVHYDDAHAIAQVEQFRSWRVVTGADSVDAHVF